MMQLLTPFAISLLLASMAALPRLHADILGEAKNNEAHKAPPNELASAIQAFENQNYLEFERCYKIATEAIPLPAAEVYWSRLATDAGQIANAITTLESYLTIHPNDPEAYVGLGYVAARTGRWTDAWLQFQHADRLIQEGNLPLARVEQVVPGLTEFRLEVAENRQQWDTALSLLSKVQESNPQSSLPSWRIGRIKVLAGEYDAGLELMAKAKERSPNLPCGHLTMAQLLVERKPWASDATLAKLIERKFRDSILSDKQSVIAWRSYFRWLLLADRSAEVLSLISRVPEPVNQTKDVQLLHALACRYDDNSEKAEEILDRLHLQYSDDIEVSDQLALVLIESADPIKRSRAKELADKSLASNPQIENVLATSGWVDLCLEDVKSADQKLSALSTRGPLSPQSAFYIGKLLEKLGRNEESVEIFERAIQSSGLFPERKRLNAKMQKDKNASTK